MSIRYDAERREHVMRKPRYTRFQRALFLLVCGISLTSAILFDARYLSTPTRQPSSSTKYVSPHSSRRIACFVLRTNSEEDALRSDVVTKAWQGTPCHWLEFIDQNTVGIIADWQEGYDFLAQKSFRAWELMFSKYSKLQVDFIMKLDLDTYIIADNLDKYIERFDPDEPHYIGRQLVDTGKEFVAGAAIILSRATLHHFMNATRRPSSACSRHRFASIGAEDLALGICLKELGIYPHNTRDVLGRERFMIFNPSEMKHRPKHSKDDWYQEFAFNSEYGLGCCSSEAITFHRVGIQDMSKRIRYTSRGQWQFQTF